MEGYDGSNHSCYLDLLTQYTEKEQQNFLNQIGFYADTTGNAKSHDTQLDKPVMCKCLRLV